MSTPGITGYPGGPYSTNSTKKYVPVVILDAILVPDLRKDTVLLSPRALFCLQGVKVYFNDELHLLLSNGSKVYLAETETAYMIELSDWNVTNLSAEAVNTISQCGCRATPRTVGNPLRAQWFVAAMVSEVAPDRIHARCMYASYQRLAASAKYVTGLDLAAIARPATVGHERDQATAPLKAKPS